MVWDAGRCSCHVGSVRRVHGGSSDRAVVAPLELVRAGCARRIADRARGEQAADGQQSGADDDRGPKPGAERIGMLVVVARNACDDGSTATASRPAARAMALLTPEAMPACRASAAARTVVVSGATMNARPSPKTVTAGRTSVVYEAFGPTRTRSSTPPAATRGPTLIGSRGPIRSDSAPARAERTSMIAVTGRSALPARSGENPATTCRSTTRKKNTPPRAA